MCKSTGKVNLFLYSNIKTGLIKKKLNIFKDVFTIGDKKFIWNRQSNIQNLKYEVLIYFVFISIWKDLGRELKKKTC